MQKSTLFFCLISIILFKFSCSTPSVQKLELINKDKIKQSAYDSVQYITNKTRENRPLPTKDREETYFGILPCGRCEGIEMWITLKADTSYQVKTNYLGLNDALEEEFTGKYIWDRENNVLIFKALSGYYSEKFKFYDGKILYLDPTGKPFSGSLAKQYILHKKGIN